MINKNAIAFDVATYLHYLMLPESALDSLLTELLVTKRNF